MTCSFDACSVDRLKLLRRAHVSVSTRCKSLGDFPILLSLLNGIKLTKHKYCIAKAESFCITKIELGLCTVSGRNNCKRLILGFLRNINRIHLGFFS